MLKSPGSLRTLSILGFLALPLATGCGTKKPPAFGDGPRRATRVEPEEERAGDVYDADDVARTGAVTAWEALDRLVKFATFTETSRGKPDRIRRRGASTINLREDMLVLVDGLRVIDVTSLADLPAGIITRIEVMSGLDGTTRYGTGATDGVILITTRAPSP